LSFDVPTTLGGTDYQPGQLVEWVSGTAFQSYFVDPSWPPSAQLRDFALAPAAGTAPDGSLVPGTPLRAVKSGASNVALSWGASCVTSDTDYEVYEGTIGTYYSHASSVCTTAGALTTTFTPAAGSTYYLVVPRNAVREGSYGKSSGGTERPVGSAPCL